MSESAGGHAPVGESPEPKTDSLETMSISRIGAAVAMQAHSRCKWRPPADPKHPRRTSTGRVLPVTNGANNSVRIGVQHRKGMSGSDPRELSPDLAHASDEPDPESAFPRIDPGDELIEALIEARRAHVRDMRKTSQRSRSAPLGATEELGASTSFPRGKERSPVGFVSTERMARDEPGPKSTSTLTDLDLAERDLAELSIGDGAGRKCSQRAPWFHLAMGDTSRWARLTQEARRGRRLGAPVLKGCAPAMR